MPAWGARPRSKSVTEACLWLMVTLLRPPLPSKGHKWVPEPGALPSIPEAGATLPASPPPGLGVSWDVIWRTSGTRARGHWPARLPGTAAERQGAWVPTEGPRPSTQKRCLNKFNHTQKFSSQSHPCLPVSARDWHHPECAF